MATPVYSDDLERRLSPILERLAAVEAQLAAVCEATGVTYAPPAGKAVEVPATVIELVRAGDRMKAMVEYRRITGASAAEAKEVLDRI